MNSWIRELKSALRQAAKNRGFSALTILTLGLSIGVVTAMFSMIYGAVFRPLPYEVGEDLLVLRQHMPGKGDDDIGFSVRELEAYQEQTQSLEALTEYHSMTFTLLGLDEPVRVRTGVVSAQFFDVLGVRPLAGRLFSEGDDDPGSEPILLISHGFWQRNLRGDPNAVGRAFTLNDKQHTVVGILPPIPQYPDENDVYMPTSACPVRTSFRVVRNRSLRMLDVFGRLKPGHSIDEARADLATIADRLEQAYPKAYEESSGFANSAFPLKEELVREARPTFLLLLGAVGLVLMIGCANVANLNLVRLVRRDREMALRTALGATRFHLFRQLATESLLLSLIGGLLGLLLTYGVLNLLIAFAGRFTSRSAEISIDGPVLLFTLALSAFVGLVFALLPMATSVARPSLANSLREGGGPTASGVGGRAFRNVLIVGQVALSFMLLVCAGLTIRSFGKLLQIDPGFDTENTLVMTVSLDPGTYDTDEKVLNRYLPLLERLENDPEIASAGVAMTYPLNDMGAMVGDLAIEGMPVEDGQRGPRADLRMASESYFKAIGMKLLEGRSFTDRDDQGSEAVAIINQVMRRRYFSGQDAVGRRVSLDRGATWMTIVGVVGDVRQYGMDADVPEELYVAFRQNPRWMTGLAVRATKDRLGVRRKVRGMIHEVDPEQAVSKIETLGELRSSSLASPRVTAALLGIFSAMALAITATGIAGLLAFSVSQRMRELGVRMALGAQRNHLQGMIVSQGMRLVGLGLVAGMAGAWLLTRLMSGMLFGIGHHDPMTFVGVSLVFLAAAGCACLVPARRATRVNPVTVLKRE